MKIKEKQSRSILKSVIWRILGVIVLATITYLITKSWIQTTWITVLHHGTFLFVYYINERFFQHVDFTGTKRAIIKCICYETILGTLILGIITLIITGDVQQMSKITIFYIGIKHIIYVFYELVWDKISWGRK